ncbi:hypothetical protein D3C85_837850 [compost metagenome]
MLRACCWIYLTEQRLVSLCLIQVIERASHLANLLDLLRRSELVKAEFGTLHFDIASILADCCQFCAELGIDFNVLFDAAFFFCGCTLG